MPTVGEIAQRGQNHPLIQLGAENNIEKSRCLAQSRKKISSADAIRAGFSGFRACEGAIRGAMRCFVHCDISHVRGDVQRNNTSSAPMAIETQRMEKSICPIRGITRRTRFKMGSHT
jgi:hypothetical protein